MKFTKLIQLLLTTGTVACGSNLANPAVTIPEARIAVGASCHIGGYSITNDEVPAIFNRFHARILYSPSKFLGLGIDLGAMQVNVDKFGSGEDSIPVFKGKYGFSGGANLKLSTPFFLNDRIAFVSIGEATVFNSKNSNGAFYKGIDGAGVLGIQFHIPGFGYITAGPLVYLMDGENQSYTGKKAGFSNTNNVRGWIAIDYFPKMKDITSNKPYISFEFSASPEANYSKRIPIQEFSFSISIGSVTNRLYGTESDIEWEP